MVCQPGSRQQWTPGISQRRCAAPWCHSYRKYSTHTSVRRLLQTWTTETACQVLITPGVHIATTTGGRLRGLARYEFMCSKQLQPASPRSRSACGLVTREGLMREHLKLRACSRTWYWSRRVSAPCPTGRPVGAQPKDLHNEFLAHSDVANMRGTLVTRRAASVASSCRVRKRVVRVGVADLCSTLYRCSAHAHNTGHVPQAMMCIRDKSCPTECTENT